MTMYKKIIGLFCVALMVTVVGCGVSRPPLTVVTGTVTYDGEVLANASISIMPSAGDGTARNAGGITNAEGKFTLVTTFPDGGRIDGAFEGTYTLRVVKYEEVDVVVETLDENTDPTAEMSDPAAEMTAMMGAEGEDSIGPKSLINEEFGALFANGAGWDNEFDVGAIESPKTLTITLNSDGTGTIE
jgi:hypothetical protein